MFLLASKPDTKVKVRLSSLKPNSLYKVSRLALFILTERGLDDNPEWRNGHPITPIYAEVLSRRKPGKIIRGTRQ